MSEKLLKTIEEHSYLGIQIARPPCIHISWNPQVDYDCIARQVARLIGFLQCNLRNCLKEL